MTGTAEPTSQRSTAVQSTANVGSIAVRVAPYDWPFPTVDDRRIETHWSQLRAQKPGLFDGRVLLARDLALHDDALHGTAFAAAYKAFLCWRDFGYPGDHVHNIFAMAALLAADGAFMLGRMSAGTANAGRLYFPAGTPEPSDAGADGVVDFDANILRELTEETGLSPADVHLDATWTIVFAGPMIACLKVARSALPASALQARVAAFIADQRDPELDGLVAVRSAADFDAARMPAFMVHYLGGALRQA